METPMQNQHLTRGLQCLYLSAYIVISACATQTFQHDERPNSPGIQANNQNPISESYQLTFTGKRSGEAYFDTKSERLIFQAEHLADNPFYQMYTMNIDSGKATLLSDGTGKTTCGYFHPQKNLALYASTHLDPEKESKQKDEIISRAHGKKKRYAWDFDLHFDIFAKDLASNQLTQLTKAKGYDAEGAYSPDGNWIVFGSNRHAYTGSLNEEDKATLSKNSAHFMEIYTMRHDGSEVQRLTHEAGYDGGPFFSPDGQRIVWRHFDSSGHQAEIWTMKTDGTDKKQITDLKAMSWAPFYHPSGEYIIFTT
ncbi:MAG: hypothetical protein CMH60_07350, partial [Myxococcales bacterium]|nr:hypothetical protein [Myxococcales bacterium]